MASDDESAQQSGQPFPRRHGIHNREPILLIVALDIVDTAKVERRLLPM